MNIKKIESKLKPKSSIPLLFALLLWLFFTDHISPNHIGIAYDALSGVAWLQEKPGWYLTLPSTFVMRMDIRPMRVTILSFANTINSKLVRFRFKEWRDYVAHQGFGYMFPYRQEFTMVGYAYSGEKYLFLEILEEPKLPL